MSAPSLVHRRPAETGGGVTAAVAGLLVYALGVDDPAVVAPLVIVVGFIPTAITWLIDRARAAK